MELIIRRVNPCDMDAIYHTLVSLCELDNDMNGENGEEYTWDDAVSDGCTSAEYLAHISCEQAIGKTKMDILKDATKYFITTWMDADCDYYNDYAFDIYELSNDDAVIALAYSLTL